MKRRRKVKIAGRFWDVYECPNCGLQTILKKCPNCKKQEKDLIKKSLVLINEKN